MKIKCHRHNLSQRFVPILLVCNPRRAGDAWCVLSPQIDQLAKVDHMYQFSLEAFEVVFNKALRKAEPADTVDERVVSLLKSITETLFGFTSRGLFGRHSLIFSTQLCLAILKKKGAIIFPVALLQCLRVFHSVWCLGQASFIRN